MDPFLEKVGWFLILSAVAGIGWVARSIVKPWSDAALARSKAFVDLVKVLETSIPLIHAELTVLKTTSRDSNAALAMNTAAAVKQTEIAMEQIETVRELTNALGSDPLKLCRADDAIAALTRKASELGMTPENFTELLGVLKDIRAQGTMAADELKKKDFLLVTTTKEKSEQETKDA